MKTTIVKKYIIYCRFSPRPDADNCESLDIQEDVCRAYVAKHGGIVVAVFGDPDLSGADEDRVGLWDAMHALKPGYTLLVWKLDRLYRSVYLSEYLNRMFKAKRAELATVENGRISQSNDDQLVRKILAAVDEHFRKIGNARTKASMLRHQKDGRAMGGEPPYGMRRAKDRRVLDEKGEPYLQRRWEDDPKEKKVVAMILKARNDEGKGYREIANELNEAGIKSRGARWSHAKIIRICEREDAETKFLKV